MSLPSPQSSVTYAGNNSTSTPYPVPFAFFDLDDIQVFVTPIGGITVQLTNGSDFTVTGGDGSTGSLVTTAAIINSSKVLIARTVPITQNTELTDLGPFPSEAVEREFDRLTMISQQLDRRIGDIDGGNLAIDGGHASNS